MNKLIKINHGKPIAILGIIIITLFILVVLLIKLDVMDLKPDFQKKIESAATILENGESIVIISPNATKLCFQPAYVSQKNYESAVGLPINFKSVESDAQFRLHVFFENGSHQQALMGSKHIRLDHQNISKTCADTKSVRLKKSNDFILINFN